MYKRYLSLALLLIFLITAPAAAGGWARVAERINAALEGALITYEKGDKGAAMEKVVDAYFSLFEAPEANMEVAVRRFISFRRAAELEKGFTAARRAMHDGASRAEVARIIKTLAAEVEEAARLLDGKGVAVAPFFR